MIAAQSKLGADGITCDGYQMKLIAWHNHLDIDVLIDGKHLRKGLKYCNFKKGQVKNLYHPCVSGKGYFGDGPHTARVDGKLSAKYNVWVGMLERCYDAKFHLKFPTYAGCEVCGDWLNYQVFADWYAANYYALPSEVTELDKDILVVGNKVYSPDTCVFVPSRVNSLFGYKRNKASELPTGVHMEKKAYVASLNTTVRGTKIHVRYLGSYKTPDEAFLVHKEAKEVYIKEVATFYKDLIPVKLYDALCKYKVLPY